MRKRFFIYEVLGFPFGPLALRTVKVEGVVRAFHVDPIQGYDTLEEAEEHLNAQEDNGLQGEFTILPVYELTMD